MSISKIMATDTKHGFLHELNERWFYFKRARQIEWSHFLYSHSAYRKWNEQTLRGLKNRYQGKRIFIVCNGPSLKPEDLERIHQAGEYSFGCNRIHYIYDKTNWRPTFFTMMDIGPLAKRIDIMRCCPAELQFYRQDAYTTIRKTGRDNICLLDTLDSPELLDHPQFMEDPLKKIYFIETTTYCMIQLAVYMGFSELYIIGCDNNYSINVLKDGTRVETGASSYFSGFGDKNDNATTVSRIWANNVAYETAQKYALEHGIRIMNATRGGHLEAFPRVEFDSLFATKQQ